MYITNHRLLINLFQLIITHKRKLSFLLVIKYLQVSNFYLYNPQLRAHACFFGGELLFTCNCQTIKCKKQEPVIRAHNFMYPLRKTGRLSQFSTPIKIK